MKRSGELCTSCRPSILRHRVALHVGRERPLAFVVGSSLLPLRFTAHERTLFGTILQSQLVGVQFCKSIHLPSAFPPPCLIDITFSLTFDPNGTSNRSTWAPKWTCQENTTPEQWRNRQKQAPSGIHHTVVRIRYYQPYSTHSG